MAVELKDGKYFLLDLVEAGVENNSSFPNQDSQILAEHKLKQVRKMNPPFADSLKAAMASTADKMNSLYRALAKAPLVVHAEYYEVFEELKSNGVAALDVDVYSGELPPELRNSIAVILFNLGFKESEMPYLIDFKLLSELSLADQAAYQFHTALRYEIMKEKYPREIRAIVGSIFTSPPKEDAIKRITIDKK